MNDPKIPNYPVVHVSVRTDGSAHVNAAGDHQVYPAGDLDVTREQVLAYAVTVAARLGRGVRMTTIDPDGEWKLAVYPDGEVVDLAPAPAKGRAATATPRPRGTAAVVPEPPAVPKDSATVGLERTTERPVPAPRVPPQEPPPGISVATLKFSTGETAIIGPPAIIGRNPSSHAADVAGKQLIVVSDRSRTVSRTHADIGWVGSKLTVSDRGAGNGTWITRPVKGRFDLTPGELYELLDGDVLNVGTDVTCVVTIQPLSEGETP